MCNLYILNNSTTIQEPKRELEQGNKKHNNLITGKTYIHLFFMIHSPHQLAEQLPAQWLWVQEVVGAAVTSALP